MTIATYNRFSVTVSTWKKSIASRPSAWAPRKVRQVSSRRVDGGTLLARRILRMVEAATRWPRRRSSPLDANHAPGPVLPRQAHDQGDRLRLPPPRGDQPAVPAQQRSEF